jgi:hypothetical protein
MTGLLNGIDVGRKNVVFGMALFALLGVVLGIPLTIDFFGGSVLGEATYRTWKVIHGYGIFLGFINYLVGFMLDRLAMTRRQKELISWSFLIAAAFGGFGRMALALVSGLDAFGVYASFGEVVFITVGTFFFISGQLHTPRAAARAMRPQEERRIAA